MGYFQKPVHRFLRYFIAGTVIEAARLLSFHWFFGNGESSAANLYSLVVGLVVGFPLMIWFVWPDRPGSRKTQVVKYTAVWLLGVLVKLPLFEVLKPTCQIIQPFIDLGWMIFNRRFGSSGFISSMVSSCPNLLVAIIDFIVAVGLKYLLFDRIVFIVESVTNRRKGRIT